uniref:Retrotransposon gag domain-containing protein n=1 Tax=Ananas comosus var. bracteatus TaxID=296719 RepID=A0A6V7PEV8_ANACO|nr:unnamed protein product [Ananas comosus var. bracteatus]
MPRCNIYDGPHRPQGSIGGINTLLTEAAHRHPPAVISEGHASWQAPSDRVFETQVEKPTSEDVVGEQIGKLRELVARQAAVAAPVPQDPPPAPVPQDPPPAPVVPTPAVTATPVTAVPPTASDLRLLVSDALEAKQERSLAALMAFKRFNPPIFQGDVKDPWLMEAWFTTMEALFEDIYTLERDKVHLAAHCLEGSARLWWTGLKKSRSLEISSLTWEAFREMLFMEYFPENDKRKIKEDFRKLRQGNRLVREYEREFSHMVDCVPSLVHGDRDRAEAFERGLRPDIFKVVHAFRLKTYKDVLNRTLWVERGNAIAREEREMFEKERDRDKSKK